MVAGNIADVVVGIQSTKGTAATPSSTNTHRVYLAGGGIAPERDVADIEETTSARLRNTAYVSQLRAGGSPEFFVRPKMAGIFLYGILGAKSVSGAGDPYTHTFTMANTQPWLTFWRMLGTILNEQFVDCKVTQLVIAGTAGQPLRFTATIMGLGPKSKTAAETTNTVETTDTFMHYDGSSNLKVEGTAVTSIESFTMTIGSGAAYQQGDAVAPDDVSEGMREVTIEATQRIIDFSLWNRLHYGSASPSDGTAATSTVLELAGSPAGIDFKFVRSAGPPERSLELLAPRLVVANITGVEPNTTGDPLKQTVTYRAYQPAAGSAVTGILKNSVASYPAS